MTKKYALLNKISGAEIKRCRTKIGLTQKDFASLCNVSTKTVERWEGTDAICNGSNCSFC